MDENDARLRVLGNKALEGAITDEELAELAQLSRAKQKLREERAALIAALKDNLQSQGITIAELFSAAEITAALPRTGSAVQRTTAQKSQRLPRGTESGGYGRQLGAAKAGAGAGENQQAGAAGLAQPLLQGSKLLLLRVPDLQRPGRRPARCQSGALHNASRKRILCVRRRAHRTGGVG